MKIFSSVLFIILPVLCSAQHAQVSTNVLSYTKTPVENATVELLKAADSVLVKTAITDKDGLVMFEKVPWGNFILKATAPNMKEQYSGAFELTVAQQQVTLPAIIMQAAAKELAGIK